MENTNNSYLKAAVEAILFVNERPVMIEQIKEALETVDLPTVKTLIMEIQKDYQDQERGMTIVEVAGGYQMVTSSLYASYLHNYFKKKVKERLSKAALETLAIVAYKQPVSRADIEIIRGVNSDGVVTHLLERELIKVAGRKEIPGRPFIYGTTKEFLEYFGLRSLKDLPKLEEFPALQAASEEGTTVKEERLEVQPQETNEPSPAPQENEAESFSVEPVERFRRGFQEELTEEESRPSAPASSPSPVEDLKQAMEGMNPDES